jgi:hypothetical protein
VRETPDDLERLQAVVDSSVERAGPFLREAFQMPRCTLAAAQLARHLTGSRTLALATATARGEPRVAPVTAVFYRGRYCVATVATAVRTAHVRRRPGVSLTDYEGNDLAVIVHGRAEILDAAHSEFADLDALQREHGQSPTEWGEGIYRRVEPERLFSFARHPERFPA